MNSKDCRFRWEENHFMAFPEKNIYSPIASDGNCLSNCYHYTTLNNFWNMIESDVFYARHVRFSNDSEEYRLGEKIVNNVLGTECEGQEDFYMMCFCQKSSLLSQWREYAKGGVCLGFDMEDEGYFTILGNEEARKKLREQAGDEKITDLELRYGIPENRWTQKIAYSYAYAKPLKVFYVGKNGKKIHKLYKKINQIYGDNREMPEDRNMRLMIPYIKHKGFKEEEEVRLVFSPPRYAHRFQVHYIDDNGIKKPFIKTEVGLAEEKIGKTCKILFDHMEGFESECCHELQNFKKCLNKAGEEIQIEYEKVNRHSHSQVIIGNCLMQEEIFYFVDSAAERWNAKHPDKKVRIWCRGHLPIREIIIGPCLNKEEVAESISHYVKNIYWLKYVQITCCSIPYRDRK